jgi:putative peptidoglycan lipid II flippase
VTQEAAEPANSAGEPKTSIAKTAGIVAVLTVLSKVVGLLRDIVINAAFPLNVVADAYNFAYLFTGNILILFGGLGGPFHSSTVAVLHGRKDDRQTGILVMQITVITFLVLTAVTIAFYFAAPHLVSLLKDSYAKVSLLEAGRLQGDFEKETLAQLRMMLPLITLSGLIGISYGVLNVYNKVATSSLSPAIASIAIIIAIWISDLRGNPDGMAIALGTLIGAVGQFAAQLPSMAKLHLNWQFVWKPQEGLKEYSLMLWPAVFSTSIGQLTVYVDAFFALQAASAWSAIVNSNRLVQLPLGILLTAMLVPILPRFTQHVNENLIDDLKDDLRKALRVLWFLALPISAIMMAIPKPIVQVLFQHGKFEEPQSQLVATALFFLVPSIFFYVARDLMTRVFYAYKDSDTPYKIALLAIIVKALLDWSLINALGAENTIMAISIATSIMTVFNLTLLVWALKKKTGNLGFYRLAPALSIMIGATIMCGAATFGVYHALETSHVFIDLPRLAYTALKQGNSLTAELEASLIRLCYVTLASGLGMLVYVGMCLLFKLEEPIAVAKRLPVLKKFVR